MIVTIIGTLADRWALLLEHTRIVAATNEDCHGVIDLLLEGEFDVQDFLQSL